MRPGPTGGHPSSNFHKFIPALFVPARDRRLPRATSKQLGKDPDTICFFGYWHSRALLHQLVLCRRMQLLDSGHRHCTLYYVRSHLFDDAYFGHA